MPSVADVNTTGKSSCCLGGAEAVEEIEDLVDHLVGAGGGAIDLVDDEDRIQTGGERLAGHEARLRHRALHRIHHEQHRVDHRQDPLHLAAEVGMPRGVHDVDPASPVLDRGGLRQDGDAAFLLEVAAVERPLGDHGARIGGGLLQQPVHERGLAVIDVGDDGDVADVHEAGVGGAPRMRERRRRESTRFRRRSRICRRRAPCRASSAGTVRTRRPDPASGTALRRPDPAVTGRGSALRASATLPRVRREQGRFTLRCDGHRGSGSPRLRAVIRHHMSGPRKCPAGRRIRVARNPTYNPPA